jgi:hypothetical protein
MEGAGGAGQNDSRDGTGDRAVTRSTEFEILGLSQDASWEDVKRAFRKLARLYHPDIAGPDGAGKFAEITEAYMALKEMSSGNAEKISQAGPPGSRTSYRETEDGRCESIFKKLWRKLFSRKPENEKGSFQDDVIPPARARFIDSIISRAESEMYGILSQRDDFAVKNKIDSVIRRLTSRHPSVVMLALRQISVYNIREEVAEAVVEHFRKNVPAADILERLLDVFSNSPKRGELVRALLPHLDGLTESDALVLLSRFRRWKVPQEMMRPFLAHRSPAVVAGALSCWPSAGISERPELAGLLKKDEEAVLVPLLRLLRREKLPYWTAGRLEKLMKHPSPAVRVWASAIVRDQNLS